MKNKEKQQSYFVNIGSSSLLVIFLILCLVTFAILSLSSAKSDHSFSQRLAQHRRVYYEASAKAEETLSLPALPILLTDLTITSPLSAPP